MEPLYSEHDLVSQTAPDHTIMVTIEPSAPTGTFKGQNFFTFSAIFLELYDSFRKLNPILKEFHSWTGQNNKSDIILMK